jgi:hypothetical protein
MVYDTPDWHRQSVTTLSYSNHALSFLNHLLSLSPLHHRLATNTHRNSAMHSLACSVPLGAVVRTVQHCSRVAGIYVVIVFIVVIVSNQILVPSSHIIQLLPIVINVAEYVNKTFGLKCYKEQFKHNLDNVCAHILVVFNEMRI